MADQGYPNPFEHVTDCAVHAAHFDDDCEFCKAEVAAKMTIVLQKQDANADLVKQINKMGAAIPAENFLNTRLELLIDVIFGKDQRQRLHFEAEYHRQVRDGLVDLRQDVARAKLKAGQGGLQVIKKEGLV